MSHPNEYHPGPGEVENQEVKNCSSRAVVLHSYPGLTVEIVSGGLTGSNTNQTGEYEKLARI